MSGFFNRVQVERLPDLTIVHLIHDMEVECCICDRPTFSKLCVPYYCGPVREGCSEGGYSHACERCYARWERWNDAGTARLYKPAHGGYPAIAYGVPPSPVAQPEDGACVNCGGDCAQFCCTTFGTKALPAYTGSDGVVPCGEAQAKGGA